jgi:uncharacterized C2H2 Zn-finger protein
MRQQTLTERRALAAYRGHHGHQKLVCPGCGKKFAGRTKLAKHAIKKHEVKQ